jgi:hypothetical protein
MLSDAERQQFDQIAGVLNEDASFTRASRTAEQEVSERTIAKPAGRPSGASAVGTQRGAWDRLCDWAERRWAARQQHS